MRLRSIYYTHADVSDRKEHHSYCNTGLDVCAIIFQSVCVLSCVRLMIRGDLFTKFTVAVRGRLMWSVSRSIAKSEVVTSSSLSLSLSLSLSGGVDVSSLRWLAVVPCSLAQMSKRSSCYNGRYSTLPPSPLPPSHTHTPLNSLTYTSTTIFNL